MKRILLLCTLVVLSFPMLSSAQNVSGDSWSTIKSKGKGTITVVYHPVDGFVYENENGDMAGIEVDIFKHFLTWVKNTQKVDIKVNYVRENNFGVFYKMVQNGDGGVFGLGNITILERRRSEVQFSPAYINNIAVLITHSSVKDLTSLDAMPQTFKGMKALAADGTTLQKYVSDLTAAHFPTVSTEVIESQNDVVALIGKDAGYFSYVDLPFYWLSRTKENLPIKRHEVGDLSSETFGIIMPLNSDWSGMITEFFNLGNGYRSTTSYRNTLMKYLGNEMTQMLELARAKSQDRR